MGDAVAIKESRTYCFYMVECYNCLNPKDPVWRLVGSGHGGNTLKDAYKRVKEDLKRFAENKADLSKIKIKIKKTVTTESIEDELTGPDFTALILK